MQSLKSDLDALANHVLETNQIFVDHYVQLVQIELKQTFFNLKEKLNFLQAKLRSFSIEIDNLMVKNEPDLITGLVRKLCPLLIECFVSPAFILRPKSIKLINLSRVSYLPKQFWTSSTLSIVVPVLFNA